MRIAYLECFAGISGDMFLGALLDAGVPAAVLHEATAALNIGATLTVEKVDRSGITSIKVHVLEDGQLAEKHEHADAEAHAHSHTGAHVHAEASTQMHNSAHDHQHHPGTPHHHESGHIHTHEPVAHTHDHPHGRHTHTHGRSLTVIRDLVRNSPLAGPVKDLAIQAFELLGESEAKIHNTPVDKIHFHEVGAVDAIVDIVCASAGIHSLNQQALEQTGETLTWHCSTVNVGGGMIQCAHGNFPVPAPATADLLRGLPTYSAHVQKELVTPTGAAILRALAPHFGAQPAMRVKEIGYGAGTRNPSGFPNVLRLSLGESTSAAKTSTQTPSHTSSSILHDRLRFGESDQTPSPHTDMVTVLETALDDLSPQILAYVTEQALALGALDVMTTAVGMKKGRPGTLLTILADEAHTPALERLLLRETSTLGIRVSEQRRICLARHHTTVATPYGDIRIKVGSFDSEAVNAAPEFEDCRAAAATHNVPVKQVFRAAIAAHVNADHGSVVPASPASS